MEKSKNVFISHYSKDEENIGKLKELLSKNGYELRNSSIDSSKPNEAKSEDYVKQMLRDRINWAGKFICLIGPHTHERKWVDWEIEQANKKGKEIIGIFINGARDADIPPNMDKYGDVLTGWDSDKIIDALEGRNKDWNNTDGTPRNSHDANVRFDC